MTDLTRVNLVVGKNSCGKISILEAIELLVSGGSISAFQASDERRNKFDEDMNYGANVSQ